MVALAWENLRRFLWCWSSFCCSCCSSLVVFLHSHFLFDIILHPSMDYHQVFSPILYFQPSPSQSDSRHFHFSTIPLSSYCKCYGFGFEWGFFTHRHFLPYTPSQHFGTTCFYQGFAGNRQLLSWKLQGFILILETQAWSICLFDSQ